KTSHFSQLGKSASPCGFCGGFLSFLWPFACFLAVSLFFSFFLSLLRMAKKGSGNHQQHLVAVHLADYWVRSNFSSQVFRAGLHEQQRSLPGGLEMPDGCCKR